MITPTIPTTAPVISERQFWAAAAALLAASALAVYLPSTANAASAFDAAIPSAPTMHSAVDWSRVPATPVDTGATVGAYER